MQILSSNSKSLSWETCDEVIYSLGDSMLITSNGLLEHLNQTRDMSDYLWYITSVKVSPSESFMNGVEWPTLSVESKGHVMHVFINGQLSGSTHGTRQNIKFTFTGKINLHAGTNRIALLASHWDCHLNNGARFETWNAGVLGPVVIHGIDQGHRDLTWQRWSYQVGLNGKAMNLVFPDGISSVEWTQTLLFAQKQQLLICCDQLGTSPEPFLLYLSFYNFLLVTSKLFFVENMVTARQQSRGARIRAKVEEFCIWYFGNQSLSLLTPILVPPTFYEMTYEEVLVAEDDHFQMVFFHYQLTSEVECQNGLRLLTEEAVTAEDEAAGVHLRKSRRKSEFGSLLQFVSSSLVAVKKYFDMSSMRSKPINPMSKFVVSSSSEETSSSGREDDYSGIEEIVDNIEVTVGVEIGGSSKVKRVIEEDDTTFKDKNDKWKREGTAKKFEADDVLKFYELKFAKGSNPKSLPDNTSFFDCVALEQIELKQVVSKLGIRRDKRVDSRVPKVHRAHEDRVMASEKKKAHLSVNDFTRLPLPQPENTNVKRSIYRLKKPTPETAPSTVVVAPEKEIGGKTVEKTIYDLERSFDRARDSVARIQHVELAEVQSQCEVLHVLNEKLNVNLNHQHEALKSVTDVKEKIEVIVTEERSIMARLAEQLEDKEAKLAIELRKMEGLKEVIRK
ncbi:hypothetical protein GIB67_027366 [Kingdonia uniflora]|uniref:Beta-galactosidase galactose-binding domain-containing protein n=1 Tax=Kingdonia uniflora TaxID=39325 RepID=A0A7J7MEZ3_9MAGN|nr:hypothetical protein GIB67_027366 [Kingdonia uniflora]